MQLETLREFIAVARHGSLTSAAKALYMSQPALSKHLASLEKCIGQKLFFDTHPLILTEAGRITMEYASKMVSQVETMEARLAQLKSHELELIRMQDLTFFEALHNEAQNFKAQIQGAYPGVTFDVVRCKPQQTSLESLLNGNIDVGFMFNITEDPFELPAGNNDMGDYCSLPLVGYSGEFRLGVRRGSPLAEKDNLRLRDFADQQFFAMATNLYDSFIQDFRAICLQEGFSPQIEFVTTDSNLDFWTRNYGNGIVFLDVTRSRNFSTAEQHLVESYKPIRPFGHERTLYVTINLITRNEKHGPALTDFLENASTVTIERAEYLKEHGLDAKLPPLRHHA